MRSESMTTMRRSDSESPSAPCVTRRQFVAALSGPLIAAAACGRRLYDAGDFQRLPKSPVVLLPAASYSVDFAELIGRGLRELRLDVRGRRVLLKPNMVEYEPGSAVNTSALVVGGAAIAMKRAGAADVVIAEGPGHRRDTEYLITRTGLYEHLRDLRIRFVDLNQDDVRDVALRSRFMGVGSLALPVELLRADLIVSMPKLKTHHWAGMTASMKNFFGVVPGAVYGWPKNFLHTHGIDNSIVDLNATIRPHLSIVDAVTAMEGDGPIMGKPRHLGFVGLGTDLPAVDASCARIIGLDPVKLPYLKAAGDFLGNIDLARIEQRGEPLARYATSFDIPERFLTSRLTQA
jgi:uncharacterized protein (DUF362 family)